MTDVEKQLQTDLRNEATRRDAFARMVRLYQEPLYRLVRRLVLDHDDADDVLQNTFMKAWTGIDSFRGESQLSTWLYRIATNESLNFLERQKCRYVSIDNGESTASQSIVSSLQSDPYFDGDETQAQLQEAIQQLPAKQRMVFNMKYFEEMKYEQMSDVLGTSVGALKASYHHAVKKISDFFHLHD